jgi:NAD(P)-dependent dehydrogenase (short-subunit alcohol dehydrogenase family)
MAVVLVTGCSSGFGRAAALAFAAAGHDVVATMRDPSAAGDLEAAAPGLGVVRLDVTDPASRRAALDTAIARHGRLDVLVNNAGISALGPAEELPEDVARAMFETNFWGPYALVREALPVLREGGRGRIVNVTSIGALLSSGFYSVYCATKHALDALSLGLDIELQQFGIRCVTVVPGGFNTSIAANRIPAAAPGSRYPRSEQAIREYEERLAARNDLTPVVDAILAAATDPSPRARYLVGEGTTRLVDRLVEEGERVHEALRARDAVDTVGQ